VPRRRIEVPRLTGRQVDELLSLLHRNRRMAAGVIVRGLHINRSSLSRWRRKRGVVQMDGVAGEVLRRLHARLVNCSDVDRKRIEGVVDWAATESDELSLLGSLLEIIGVPTPGWMPSSKSSGTPTHRT